jgi:hypothetical protein
VFVEPTLADQFRNGGVSQLVVDSEAEPASPKAAARKKMLHPDRRLAVRYEANGPVF